MSTYVISLDPPNTAYKAERSYCPCFEVGSSWLMTLGPTALPFVSLLIAAAAVMCLLWESSHSPPPASTHPQAHAVLAAPSLTSRRPIHTAASQGAGQVRPQEHPSDHRGGQKLGGIGKPERKSKGFREIPEESKPW